MSGALEKARAHYQAAIAGELQSLYVEEWDETVYYRPSMTLAQNAKVLELQNQGKLAEAMVETLIQQARTEDGNRMFRPADRPVLMKSVDLSVVSKIVNEILGAEPDEIKND